MRALRSVFAAFLVLAVVGTVMPVFAGQADSEEPRSSIDWRFQSSKPRPGSNPSDGVILLPAPTARPAGRVRLIALLFEAFRWSRCWLPVGR
jgi:hypothetical protein